MVAQRIDAVLTGYTSIVLPGIHTAGGHLFLPPCCISGTTAHAVHGEQANVGSLVSG